MLAPGKPRSLSQSTAGVPIVDSSITRAHERRKESPTGVHALFAESQSRPFSQTESSTRSSFVASAGVTVEPPALGCLAGGGCCSGDTGSVAVSRMETAAGGIPSTASRWTTREVGLSTETTYSVDVAESDCTGARLAYRSFGPYVVDATSPVVESSCCLLITHISPPSTGAGPALSQSSKMSAASTTMPSATPSRGWSAQPAAANERTVHTAVGSLVRDTASNTA